MIVRIHKIHWSKERNSIGKDLDFNIVDVDCFVQRVGHKCMKWAINEAWFRVSMWLEKKGAQITLGEPQGQENKK